MRKILMPLLLGLLTACTSSPMKLPTLAGPATRLASVTSDAPTGTLVITVRWPRTVQTIPYSTNLVQVQVNDASGAALASTSVQQSSGVTTSTAELPVPAGNNLSVDVKGFQDSVLLAEGQATTSIAVNQRSSVAVHLTPRYVPTLDAYDSNAPEGATVELIGRNFGASRGVAVSLTFAGIASPGVYPVDDEHLRATVPAGFASGSIVVTADGVSSAPSGIFRVLKALSALRPADHVMTVGASISLSLSGTAADGATVDPVVSWRLLPVNPGAPGQAASGSLTTASGSAVFTATGTGSLIVSVGAGSLVSTTSLTVQ